MELSERYTALLIDFERAIEGFQKAVNYNISDYSEFETDIFRNGCIQKFEYCTELAWKLGKVLLEWQTGQEYNSPKPVYRAMFSEQYIDESLNQCLLKTIDDRNALSHVYKEELFELVLAHLPAHAECLHSYLTQLKQIKLN